MAMDNTPPRTRLIALYTAVAVGTLVMLKPAFDAYYDWTLRRATTTRLESTHDLNQVEEAKASWAEALSDEQGMPIERAFAELDRQGRLAFPAIRPQPAAAMDLDPLRGWSQLPREVTAPQPAPEVVPTEAVPAEGELPPEGAVEAPPEAAPEPAPAPEPPAPAPEAEEPRRTRVRPTRPETTPRPARPARAAPARPAPARPTTARPTTARPAPARPAPARPEPTEARPRPTGATPTNPFKGGA
jgi:hypothetical protein